MTTILIAGSDASANVQAAADYVCSGTITGNIGDEVQFNEALASIAGTTGGKVIAIGTFLTGQSIIVRGDDVELDLTAARFSVPARIGTNNGINGQFMVVGRGTLGSVTCAKDGSNNLVFTMTDVNGYLVDDVLYIAGGTLPDGMDSNTGYYVVAIDRKSKAISLSATQGGSPLNVGSGSAGSGTQVLVYAFYTYTQSTNVLVVGGTSPPTFADGTPVILRDNAGADGTADTGCLPVWVKGTGTANNYNLYADAAMTVAATTPAGNVAFDSSHINSIWPMTRNVRIIGVNVEFDPSITNTGPVAFFARDTMDCTLEGARMDRGKAHLTLRGYRNTYRNIRSTRAGGDGIDLGGPEESGAGPLTTSCTLDDAVVDAASAYGIWSDCPQNLFSNVTARYCGSAGLVLDLGSDGSVVDGFILVNNCQTEESHDLALGYDVTNMQILGGVIVEGPQSDGAASYPDAGFSIIQYNGNLIITGGAVASLSSGVYKPLSVAPSSPVEGQMYYNVSAHKLMVYTGSAWETISSS